MAKKKSSDPLESFARALGGAERKMGQAERRFKGSPPRKPQPVYIVQDDDGSDWGAIGILWRARKVLFVLTAVLLVAYYATR